MNYQFQLPELVRLKVRQRALSRKTENAYLNHIRRFLEYYAGDDVCQERADKISRFLEYLGKTRAASTCNQAHSALLFLYREVLGQKLSERFGEIGRVRCETKNHTSFSHAEAKAVLANLRGAMRLVAALIYGSGLRVSEVISLRVGDVDFERMEINIRDEQTGAIDHTTILPASIIEPLKRHLVKIKFRHEEDCLLGFGESVLPDTVSRQNPPADSEFNWQYLFPAAKLTPVKNGKTYLRLHLSESTVRKAVAEAVRRARIKNCGGCQSLRYSFASRLFENNCDIHTISRLLGHKTLKTTVNYFETGNETAIKSPLD